MTSLLFPTDKPLTVVKIIILVGEQPSDHNEKPISIKENK